MVIILVACHCGIATSSMYMMAENCLIDGKSIEDCKGSGGKFSFVE